MNKKSLKVLNNAVENNELDNFGSSRRNFLKILGASTAVVATGCADSAQQQILPHVKGDPEANPGVAVWYSSTCTECSAGCGIRVRTREGRAVKIEGNPDHPVNQGGLCAMGQAALQGLYDPDRIRQPLVRNASGNLQPTTWADAMVKVSSAMKEAKGKKAFISGSQSGTQKDLLDQWCDAFNCEQLVYEPFDQVDLAEACDIVYGKKVIPNFAFENSDLILSFGADFLETWIAPTQYARGWSKAKKQKHPVKFVHIEPRLSLTGANADMWLAGKPASEIAVAKAILSALIKQGKGKDLSEGLISDIKKLCGDMDAVKAAKISGIKAEKILLITQFCADAKSPLVIAGGAAGSSNAARSLHVVTQLINLVSGSVGKTVTFGAVRKPQSDLSKLGKLIEKLESKQEFSLVFVSGTNPAYSLPSAQRFNYALRRAGLVVSISTQLDETARLADVVLPMHTSLESWGDNDSVSGFRSLMQPTMTPVFDTKSFGDLLLQIAKDAGKESVANGSETYKDYLMKSWEAVYASTKDKPANFRQFWLDSLDRGGYFAEYDSNGQAGEANTAQLAKLESKAKFFDTAVGSSSPVLLPYASVRAFDGRAANKPWLHELPDPVTKIVWGSWVEMHPKTAKKYGIKQGGMVKLSNKFGEVNAPAYVTEYVSEDVVAVPIGSGHSSFGRYAEQIQNGNVLQMIPDQLGTTGGVSFLSTKVKVSEGRGNEYVVQTQGSDSQMGRDIARTKFIGNDHHDDHHGHHGHHEPKQMYEQRKHPLYKWAMAVDLAACTGCSACVVACYAENNIPVVGRKVAYQGREMSWLRIERYYEGSAEELQVSFIPMMCQHCNNAPCEPVCPVYATYHNEEGTNAMVYNRCVGTRYCGNNCSYKVRRFNWFEFDWPEPLNMQLNPDVTKRTAGVMEKCSFCVQRINDAKDHAKDEGRMVADGEIKPACVQSCPTEALVFGDINDPNSKVSKLAHSDRAYKVLDHHLNTQPAVNYLENVKYKI
jgi:anaerobic selenocysteine-containing dehydrogenase/Fe-S-cluster-containing dehydrogenase component